VDSLNLKRIKSFVCKARLFIRHLAETNKSLLFSKKKNNYPQRDNWDRQLVYSLSKSRIPTLKQIKYLKKFLSPREVLFIKISLIVILLNLLFLGVNFYRSHLQVVPARGGEYVEAIVGRPQYINPLYDTINDVDHDISSLVFSSLFKRDENGELVPDIVDSYEVQDNGRVYIFKIKDNIRWHHSGEELNADDVIFTVEAIKNPAYKSPLALSFSGVKVEKIDDKTIKFSLGSPYAAFLELLTFGILPQKIWSAIPSESANLVKYNLKPIGSGPYQFEKLIKDENTGRITSYILTLNDNYYGPKPYIEKIIFKFYPTLEEAISVLNQNLVDGISYLPSDFKNELVSPGALNFYRLTSPQLTAIFFNTKSKEYLADRKIRQALAYAINRQEIIDDILLGEAVLVDSPIFINSFAYNNNIHKYNYDPQKAGKILDELGWKLVEIDDEKIKKAEEEKNSEEKETKDKALEILSLGKGSWREKDGKYLILRLITIDRDHNGQIIEKVKNYWEKIGVKTFLEVVPTSQITEIIKARNFDALFYGQIVGIDPDSYVFWHSSQANESGLNITNYNNKEVDKLLEEGRIIIDKNQRTEKYKRFQEILTEDEPAIFMYSPFYIYVQNKKVKNFHTKIILSPNGRFSTISDWYIKTSKKIVW